MSTKKTILCVDDEEYIRELFSEELRSYGFDVIEAANGVEAFELYKKHKIDGIVSDIRMPEGDGVGLVKNIKKINAHVPIFLITGFSDYSEQELQDLFVNGIIYKPFDIEAIGEMIAETVRRPT